MSQLQNVESRYVEVLRRMRSTPCSASDDGRTAAGIHSARVRVSAGAARRPSIYRRPFSQWTSRPSRLLRSRAGLAPPMRSWSLSEEAARYEFRLVNDESTIGRWDADNGVFPDVDLDPFDSDAKVSQRHARIRRANGAYYDRGSRSTNGTYVNRGRRLLPGKSETLNDGDEVIVGKTFLRFQLMH